MTNTRRYNRLLVSAWLLTLGTLLAVATARVLLVLFAGVLFAIVLRAAARWLSTVTRLPVPVALTGLVTLSIGLTTTAVVLGAPVLSEQVSELVQQLPDALKHLRAHLSHIPVLQAASSGATSSPPTPGPGSAGATAMKALGSSVEIVSGLVIVFFVGVYGAAQPEMYLRAVRAITPKRYRDRVTFAIGAVHHHLSRWLAGRLIAMVFVGVTTSIAFQVLGLPFALVLGIFAGLLTFIEYAGAVISAVPPVLLALLKSASTAIWVLAVYTALHIIEGYVLTPLLARAMVRLPPAFTLAAQVTLGVLLGPLGLTFSTPLLVVLVASIKAWNAPHAVAESFEPGARKKEPHPESARRGLRDHPAF